jgi:hypothetical protein
VCVLIGQRLGERLLVLKVERPGACHGCAWTHHVLAEYNVLFKISCVFPSLVGGDNVMQYSCYEPCSWVARAMRGSKM